MTVNQTGKWESESKITPTDHPAPLLKTLSEASQVPISKSYLAKLRMGTNKKQGPRFVKIGLRAVRYRCADLDDWIEAKLVNTV